MLLVGCLCLHGPVVYLCVCRTLRTFIETSAPHRPYEIAVVSYEDILVETGTLESITPIDKLFIFQVPHFLGEFWRKLHGVKFWETVTFIYEPPQYNLPNVNPPPFFMIPRGVGYVPPTDYTPTYFLH